jgi:phosphoribosylglycinamide formyltransferase-1
MKKIVIFASGNGTNAENLILSTAKKESEKVRWKVYSNNASSGVIQKCKNLNIKCRVFNKSEFISSNIIYKEIKEINPDLIILAGFLLKISEDMIDIGIPIINIHPSLLPKYGGKGMYGINVHKAVIENKEKESGITIHRVNKDYDKGEILLQKKVSLEESESIKSLILKIHKLEMKYFPKTVNNIVFND